MKKAQTSSLSGSEQEEAVRVGELSQGGYLEEAASGLRALSVSLLFRGRKEKDWKECHGDS